MKIVATTLSVIQRDSDSVHCYLEINGESCNVTLRFDRGLKAQVCGYPMDWGVHDVPVEYYNSESPTYAELMECDGIAEGTVYISAELEVEILKALKRSVARQFRSKSWGRTVPKQRKQILLNKITRAIKAGA